MKKIYLLFLALFVLSIGVQAKQVGLATAQKVAVNFLNSKLGEQVTAQKLSLAFVEKSKATSATAQLNVPVYFYIFNIGQNGGIIIVSGDDKVIPVLAYTKSGSYSSKNLPPSFVKWLEYYKSQIRYAIVNYPENKETQKEWNNLVNNASTTAPKFKKGGVSPLISTTWDQEPYYNALCPYDNASGQRTVTGCVATAMAQILKYWDYPKQGTGFHSYKHSTYGTLSANFGSTTYDWSSMPNSVTSANSAVATLMYQCGVSVDMNYGIANKGGSGAYVISSQSPVTNCAEYAFKTYFGYKDVQGLARSNYSLTDWVQKLEAELTAGRPVLYAGFGSGGGHCFDLDGFDNNDYFHLNWGWSGYYNGYFKISALNPGGVGTGGGNGGYNSGQQAVIGIKPPGNTAKYQLQLYDNVTSSASQIYYGGSVTIHTDILNSGSSNFKGDFCAAAFDQSGNFVDFINTLANNSLPSNYHYTNGLDFTTKGLFTLLPGDYDIYCFYRPTGGNWVLLQSTSYTEYTTLSVTNPNSMELYSDISLTPADNIYAKKPLSVNLDVANYGSSSFTGSLDVSLYNLDGTFAKTVETKNNVSLCSSCHFQNGLTFSTNNLDVNPGSYLLALTHKPSGGNWELTGSTYHTNPIEILVKASPLSPDKYEVNDKVSEAYAFYPTFTSNSATVLTTGSNNHTGNDLDYYKVILPAGYSYVINARVYDKNSPGTGTYTNDVLFSWSSNGTDWSDTYDNVMPNNITLTNGGTLYFLEAPYFQGTTGTYLLQAQIQRQKNNNSGIGKQASEAASIKIFPNPTSDKLCLSDYSKVQNGKITDINGRVLMQFNKPTQPLDVSNLAKGVYFIEISTANSTHTFKFFKQ